MHAIVVMVEIDPSQAELAEKLLNEVTVPMVKGQPGFVRGTWARSADGTQGRSLIVFDTEEHANAVVPQVKPPEGSPVTVKSVEVYEVLAEA